jgi:CBS domain-containing protein
MRWIGSAMDGIDTKLAAPTDGGRVDGRMRRAFVHASARDTRQEVAALMRMARLRDLVVLDGERLLGIVSYRELAELVPGCRSMAAPFTANERSGSEPIADSLRGIPACVRADDTLAEAARTMLERALSCLPVVDAGSRVIGLVAEGDLLAAAYGAALDPRPAASSAQVHADPPR